MRSLVVALPLALAVSGLACAVAAAAQIETLADHGLSLPSPAFTQGADGLAVRGIVCRRPGHTATSRVTIRLQRIDGGRTLDEAGAATPGALGERDHGCGVYTVRTGWILRPGETLRLCADRGEGSRCGLPPTAK